MIEEIFGLRHRERLVVILALIALVMGLAVGADAILSDDAIVIDPYPAYACVGECP